MTWGWGSEDYIDYLASLEPAAAAKIAGGLIGGGGKVTLNVECVEVSNGESEELSGAIISECGQYRYHLWRVWNQELPIMVFVMQNPSTADATEDDPTIRRCIGFAKRDGFGGISVRNVFALRATDERVLLTHPDPFGPENEKHLLAARSVSLMTRLVVAWGNRLAFRKGSRQRDAYCKAAGICTVQHAYCFGTTKSGDPRHPLYLPKNAELVRWTAPGY